MSRYFNNSYEDDMYEDALMHWGIAGMKWNKSKRKWSDSDYDAFGNRINVGKNAYNKATKTGNQAANNAKNNVSNWLKKHTTTKITTSSNARPGQSKTTVRDSNGKVVDKYTTTYKNNTKIDTRTLEGKHIKNSSKADKTLAKDAYDGLKRTNAEKKKRAAKKVAAKKAKAKRKADSDTANNTIKGRKQTEYYKNLQTKSKQESRNKESQNNSREDYILSRNNNRKQTSYKTSMNARKAASDKADKTLAKDAYDGLKRTNAEKTKVKNRETTARRDGYRRTLQEKGYRDIATGVRKDGSVYANGFSGSKAYRNDAKNAQDGLTKTNHYKNLQAKNSSSTSTERHVRKIPSGLSGNEFKAYNHYIQKGYSEAQAISMAKRNRK